MKEDLGVIRSEGGGEQALKDVSRVYGAATAESAFRDAAHDMNLYPSEGAEAFNQKCDQVAEGMHASFGLDTARCLVPKITNTCKMIPLPSKEELWDKYYTGAPQQLRQHVEQYKIVKRAKGH